MSSKIPLMILTPGTAKTDDEKLKDKYKGAKPKQTISNPSANSKRKENCEATKMRNVESGVAKILRTKSEVSSGAMTVSKTTKKILKDGADFSKKENFVKSVSAQPNSKTLKLSEVETFGGSDKENPQKPKEAKKENCSKTELKLFSKKVTAHGGIKFIPSKRRKSTFHLDIDKILI